MANIKSQIKRNRQNLTRHARNKAVRSRVKTYVKRFEAAVGDGDHAAAEARYRDAARELDKAVSKGVVHRNQAANKKSAMARRLSQQ